MQLSKRENIDFYKTIPQSNPQKKKYILENAKSSEEIESSLKYTEKYFQSMSLHQSNNLSSPLQSLNFSNQFQKNDICSSVLDSQQRFSPNSPSNMKVVTDELNEIKRRENMNIKFTDKNEYIIFCIDVTFDELDDFQSLKIDDKILRLLSLIDVNNEKIRLGSVALVYILLSKYFDQAGDKTKEEVVQKIIWVLNNNYEREEELYLVSCLNVCSLFGSKFSILTDNIGLISMFITDFNYPLLQRAAFVALMSLGYSGIKTLIDLSIKDYMEYQSYILSNLLQTPHIQKTIIVKALVNDLSSKSRERVNEALAALNRLYDMISEEKVIQKIASMFYEKNINKVFIASILHLCHSEYAEWILLNEVDNSQDPAVREAICKAFGRKTPVRPNRLKIKIDKNDTTSVMNSPPGLFCKYFGKVTPLIDEVNIPSEDDDLIIHEDEEGHNIGEEYLEVNTRDFLAALKRMISLNYDHNNPKIVNDDEKKTFLDTVSVEDVDFNKYEHIAKYADLLTSFSLDKKYENLPKGQYEYKYPTEIDGKYSISKQVIRALIAHLEDTEKKVQIACGFSLGQISLPESLPAVNYLIGLLSKTKDPDLKASVIWALGRNSEGVSSSIIPHLSKMLQQSNMWKVKRALLFTISKFGARSESALPLLSKILKETPINKQLVAEAMVYIGPKGETELLSIMSNKMNESNYKLLAAIIRSFAFCNIQSKNIDFVIECLFTQINNANPHVRRNALRTISHLAKKANAIVNPDGNVIYLSQKNVIPFYYSKLKDKDEEVQKFAIKCLQSYGAKGELILMEGMRKETNAQIRGNCGVALAENGAHCLRCLINNGICDKNDVVRMKIQKSIVANMKPDDVVEYYKKTDQLMSLKILIDDMLGKMNEYLISQFVSFCKDIIRKISSELK